MNYRSFLLFFTCFCFAAISGSFAQGDDKDLYEIKIYHLQNEQQENRVDDFLEKAFLPALDRAGIDHVGVFKPIEGDSARGKKIVVFIPYSSIQQFRDVPEALEKDKKYKADGTDYLDAPHNEPPYSRFETTLLRAFKGMPNYRPNQLSNSPSERVYELRSYEAATENLYLNKVKMFDEGEIEIFERLEFNPIFFGEVIAGSNMPNLMYMTSFTDTASRDAHWEAFGKDEQWGEMSSMEEYQNNVSHIDTFLLQPTAYSKL